MLEETRKKIAEKTAEDCDSQKENNPEESKDFFTEKEKEKKDAETPASIEEDLEFLLSLKEPVRTNPISIGPIAKNSEGKKSIISQSTKKKKKKQ